MVIFVDELNKYAPAGGQGGLRDTLVDIAARGRHLNVVLFGAEQFRSKVDDEILGNCGTSFYGRVGDEEMTNAAYRSLTRNDQSRSCSACKKGRMLARHAHFRAPLFGTFPLQADDRGHGRAARLQWRTDGDSRGTHRGWSVQDRCANLMATERRTNKSAEASRRTDPETLDEIVRQVERRWRTADGKSGHAHGLSLRGEQAQTLI